MVTGETAIGLLQPMRKLSPQSLVSSRASAGSDPDFAVDANIVEQWNPFVVIPVRRRARLENKSLSPCKQSFA